MAFENKKHWQQQTSELIQLYLILNQKKAIIYDLIEVFTIADILLEKVNFYMNFLRHSVKRSFFKYNSILDDNQQNLSMESLSSLNILYFKVSQNYVEYINIITKSLQNNKIIIPELEMLKLPKETGKHLYFDIASIINKENTMKERI
ncbi:hypothetical protein RhiirA4_486496 [Rhizophagus irregularis]|uniref:Uncharacterized protein n=1 Tax=Rhizophagus irregularis TaxID=588596 RepID=A0A2I1HRF8_9GLOM|nr:hypothetical protein RhiirA4_486496 [Rhizophagus irregularis]